MRRLLLITFLTIIVALLGGCGRSLSPEEAQALLRQVQVARRTLTLDANLTTSVRMGDKLLEADAKVQRAPGLIHVQYLSGRFKGWEVVEQDGLVWRIDPQGKPRASAVGAEPGMNFGARMLPNVSVRYAGIGWAAGRRVARYELEMNHPGAPRVELAIDPTTHYPLRLIRRNDAGEIQSATILRTVNYKGQAPERLPVPAVASAVENLKRARPATEQQLTKLLGGPLLRPAYVPAGFKLRGLFIHQNPRRRAAEIRYSDGLRVFAVMQSVAPKHKQQHPRDGSAHQKEGSGPWSRWFGQRPQGADHRSEEGRDGGNLWRSTWRGSVLRERRGNRMVMVVGEL
ncbi:MAG: hypothetical protein ACM3VW_10065, partial [Bacteroidota bacterium]